MKTAIRIDPIHVTWTDQSAPAGERRKQATLVHWCKGKTLRGYCVDPTNQGVIDVKPEEVRQIKEPASLNRHQFKVLLSTVFGIKPDRWGHLKWTYDDSEFRFKIQATSWRFEMKLHGDWIRIRSCYFNKTRAISPHPALPEPGVLVQVPEPNLDLDV